MSTTTTDTTLTLDHLRAWADGSAEVTRQPEATAYVGAIADEMAYPTYDIVLHGEGVPDLTLTGWMVCGYVEGPTDLCGMARSARRLAWECKDHDGQVCGTPTCYVHGDTIGLISGEGVGHDREARISRLWQVDPPRDAYDDALAHALDEAEQIAGRIDAMLAEAAATVRPEEPDDDAIIGAILRRREACDIEEVTGALEVWGAQVCGDRRVYLVVPSDGDSPGLCDDIEDVLDDVEWCLGDMQERALRKLRRDLTGKEV